jgi:hypothetical protein
MKKENEDGKGKKELGKNDIIFHFPSSLFI